MMVAWTMAYGLMVRNSWKYGHDQGLYMPLVPGALNLSWELCPVFSSATLGRLAWLCLDFAIFVFNISAIKRMSNKCIYIAFAATACLILQLAVVNITVDFLLLSSFATNLSIGLFYLIDIRHISKHNVYLIALLRTFGDLFAWMAYGNLSAFIFFTGLTELLLNVLFFAARIEIDSNGGMVFGS